MDIDWNYWAYYLWALLLVAGGNRPVRASEEWPSDHGFEIGFRTGASFPVGDVESGWPLSDSRGVQVPLWLDLEAALRLGALTGETHATAPALATSTGVTDHRLPAHGRHHSASADLGSV